MSSSFDVLRIQLPISMASQSFAWKRCERRRQQPNDNAYSRAVHRFECIELMGGLTSVDSLPKGPGQRQYLPPFSGHYDPASTVFSLWRHLWSGRIGYQVPHATFWLAPTIDLPQGMVIANRYPVDPHHYAVQ